MKFKYPDLSASPFMGRRFYSTPGGRAYPSITTVLGGSVSKEKQESLSNWQKSIGMEEAERITSEAAVKGTAVHLIAERFLNGDDLKLDEFSEEEVKMFNGLKLKLKKVEEVWGQEVALFSDLIEVAGRCDVIGVYNGKPSIIDFKTSRSLKSEDRIEDYKLQLCAYSIMHNEMFGTDIEQGVILMTSAGGFPQEFIVDLPAQVDKLVLRVDQFYSKLMEEIA